MKRYSLFLISLILLMTTGCNQRKEVAENPFFEEWETPYGVPPFDRIRPEHFLPAFQRAMSIQEAEIDAIKSNGDQPSFENVILAYDRSGLMLEQVGLGDKLKNKPNQLSGGQQQRVSIARALAGNPAVILADEPTGALDSHTGREVLGLLQQLHKQGHTVVLITHDNSIAVQADRIIRLEDGRVVYDGDSHAPEAMVQPTLLPETPEKEEQA